MNRKTDKERLREQIIRTSRIKDRSGISGEASGKYRMVSFEFLHLGTMKFRYWTFGKWTSFERDKLNLIRVGIWDVTNCSEISEVTSKIRRRS